ncbi:PQQ-like beta-propeller repeat protein [Halorarum halophilum]|uniref:PQQ-like beta-propeller repeat protein n=1 Tax=Halorarum halophilum TaxID=2743090 RepID=A0A7D5KGS3_9EURY|nr:PQQ-binding-like beta-propeller repeat protein [Halobaculum halophilum]QLG28536.1 PQQ-like beta-propeller repeat protein [Halobaculum halophilum]
MSHRYTRRTFGAAVGGIIGAAGLATGENARLGGETTTSDRTSTQSEAEGTDWPAYRAAAGSTASNPGAGSPTTGAQEAWEWNPDDADASMTIPVVADGTVYVTLEGDSTVEVVALDSADASVRWRTAVEDTSNLSVPAAVGDAVYVVGGDSTVYALDAADGSIRSTTPFGETTRDRYNPAPPRIVGGTLYAAVSPTSRSHPSRNAVVAAIPLDSCGGSWTVTIEGTEEHDARVSTPAVSDGKVFVVGWVDDTGFLRAISAATGETEWELQREGGDNWQYSPIAADGTVYALTDRGILLALDADDGTEQWQYRGWDRVHEQPAVTEDAVYAVTNVEGGTTMDPAYGAIVAALDPETGTELWRREAPASCGPESIPGGMDCDLSSSRWSEPSVGNGAVYTSLSGAAPAGLNALDVEDGERLWQLGIDPRHAPVLAGGAMYLARPYNPDAGRYQGLVKLEESTD